MLGLGLEKSTYLGGNVGGSRRHALQTKGDGGAQRRVDLSLEKIVLEKQSEPVGRLGLPVSV